MNILVPVIVGIAVGLLFAVRRGLKPRDIARSLSPADRQFIADQIDPQRPNQSLEPTGISEGELTHEEVLETGKNAAADFARLLEAAL